MNKAPVLFTQDHLDGMRRQYATVERIDPCAPTYQRLTKTLDAMPQPMLQQLAGAGIKFVSALARNRCKVSP